MTITELVKLNLYLFQRKISLLGLKHITKRGERNFPCIGYYIQERMNVYYYCNEKNQKNFNSFKAKKDIKNSA